MKALDCYKDSSVKLEFACKRYYFLGTSTFNSLPIKTRQISGSLLFRKSVDEYFVWCSLHLHSNKVIFFLFLSLYFMFLSRTPLITLSTLAL